MKKFIKVQWLEIKLLNENWEKYLSLIDIARKNNPKSPASIIKNWLKNKSTIEFLWTWEKINNLNFKLVEFDQFRNISWNNTFVLTPQKWIKETNAIWIISKSWRYGWTFAHIDIALEFASWISEKLKDSIVEELEKWEQDDKWDDFEGLDISFKPKIVRI